MKSVVVAFSLILSASFAFADGPNCAIHFARQVRSEEKTTTPVRHSGEFDGLEARLEAVLQKHDLLPDDVQSAEKLFVEIKNFGSPTDRKIFDAYLSILERTSHYSDVYVGFE